MSDGGKRQEEEWVGRWVVGWLVGGVRVDGWWRRGSIMSFLELCLTGPP